MVLAPKYVLSLEEFAWMDSEEAMFHPESCWPGIRKEFLKDGVKDFGVLNVYNNIRIYMI